MATPLPIRSFRGGQQSGLGRLPGGKTCSSTSTYAYLGSSPPGSPSSRAPYLTLGVTSTASVCDIKKAYRRLVLKYHPDVCKGDSCASKFIQVNDAYETIMGFLEGSGNAVHQYDESWNEGEEWMGYEGAWIRDYSPT